MDFGHRLKHFRTEKNMTQQELASVIGVTTVCVGNWERGARKPTMDMLIALSTALGISMDALVGVVANNAVQPMLSGSELTLLNNYKSLDIHGKKAVDAICIIEKQRVDAAKKEITPKITDFPKFSERFIPRYSTPSAAGFNVPLDGTNFEMILVDDSTPEDADYAVDIQGDSMYPYIHDGEMVYVKKDAELQIGDVGIFCVDGTMYCKQYYLEDDGTLMLVSANPELQHTNIVLSPDSGSEVRACGKVLLDQRVELPDYLFED